MRLTLKKEKRPFENTIPLINVVFLMLIFFLFAGTIDRDSAKDINPAEVAEEAERELIAGALIVDAEGAMTMEGAEISLPDIADTGPYSKEAPLMLVADKSLNAKSLTRLLGQLKKLGVNHISLITIKGQGNG
ncbi:ExbD/TolR family protein [Flexibacterium corallicola]|uniref:ExbD/TolR family protein n=1 Tax=Flexibacterium corallicola TaxID=3037259 RepID=UPI00286F7382|nr:biopolymer transporter ExbD [Pseudovibrio sp. M1P-2-3]